MMTLGFNICLTQPENKQDSFARRAKK